MRSSWTVPAPAATALIGVTGCAVTGEAPEPAAQAPTDAVPPQITAGGRDWDPESSRLLGEYQGYRFFSVRSPGDGTCLVTVDARDPGSWNGGCTPNGEVATEGIDGVKARYAPGGLPDEELPGGWAGLTPQLHVRTPG